MKRKLSLLLAMVLAMTMVMGISVTAFAEIDPPVSHVDPCHCENTDVANALIRYFYGSFCGIERLDGR